MSDQASPEPEPAEAAPQLVVKLNRQAVVDTILRSLSDTLAVMRVCVPALLDADLTTPKGEENPKVEKAMAAPAGSRVPMSFELIDQRTPEDRKAACVNWILSRGFQELARAVRNALEEAHLYIAAVEYVSGRVEMNWGDFQAAIAPAAKQARKLNFPDLLEAVNKRLSQPLHFENEFRSFQRVRNCLEHRAGVVTRADIDTGNALVLSLPRLVIFYVKGGKEIEVRAGEKIEGEDGQGARIFLRMGTGSREFKIGERVLFSANEFEEIGLGCWAFANDLSQKLPIPKIDRPAKAS